MMSRLTTSEKDAACPADVGHGPTDAFTTSALIE
jgi:hypothetical protein